jgi:hypothetical protein
VLVMERRMPPRADFLGVRDRVYNAYRAAQSRRAGEDNLRLLRRDARILLAPGESE